MPQIAFAQNAYVSRIAPLAAQRLINLYPQIAPKDAKSTLALIGTPGLKNLTTSGLGGGPVRGEHVMAGVLYVVSDTALYAVDSAGVATSKGTGIPGTGVVRMADNGTQLAIVVGTKGYIYTVAGGLAVIADADFPAAVSDVTHIDQYFLWTVDSTDQFVISALADGTAYDATDIATAESNPDNLVGCINDHREAWLFGETSTEVWYNSGASGFPFERVQGAVMERGCYSKETIAKMDNSVFWLGDDLIVYRADGYTPRRISTHAIERELGACSDLSNARAWTYTQEGHAFYVFHLPACGTFVYDAANGRWHERQTITKTRWRAEHYAFAYGKHIVGDFEAGKLYELDLDTYTDGGDAIQRIATSPPVHGGDRRLVSIAEFEVEFEAGVGLTSGQGADPQAMLRWSEDGGKTWSNEVWAAIGKIGQYANRARWRRLGAFRQRIFEVTVSDPVKVGIIGAFAN